MGGGSKAIHEGRFMEMMREFQVIYDSSRPEIKNTSIKNNATRFIAERTSGSREMVTKCLKTIRRRISTMPKEYRHRYE